MGSDYQVRTKKGYDFFEVSSAFQKSIRRGLEDDAMYWAVELYDSGYQNYVWKRMIVMASEDVGLGDSDVVVKIMALKQSFDFFVKLKDTHGSEKLPFTQAVLMLVRAKKSRYVDHAITYYWQGHATQYKQIPDWAYDMHTRRGKELHRGLKYFYQESVKIANANKVEGEEELERLAMEIDKVSGVNREDTAVEDTKAIIQERAKPQQFDLFAEKDDYYD